MGFLKNQHHSCLSRKLPGQRIQEFLCHDGRRLRQCEHSERGLVVIRLAVLPRDVESARVEDSYFLIAFDEGANLLANCLTEVANVPTLVNVLAHAVVRKVNRFADPFVHALLVVLGPELTKLSRVFAGDVKDHHLSTSQ